MTVPGEGRVHFVGIGGAGMSAIAKVLVEQGREVSGSDLKRSRATTVLEAMGAAVHIGHDAALVEGAGVVVSSAAIGPGNPELVRAAERGIPVVGRGEALAALLRGRASVVVAGTHGKTTTTSMIVSILRSAGRDPTYLVGGGLNDVGTNARWGRDELVVAEADESDGSFLLIDPHIAVVTNVEADHLDHWGSFDALRAGFARFLERVGPSGVAVVPAGDAALVAAVGGAGRRTLRFGDGAEVAAREVVHGADGVGFVIEHGGRGVATTLRVRGDHNVANALAAAAASLAAGVSLDDAARGLAEFRGVERRFQLRGRAAGVTVVDDYAHHPTEVRATLASARPGPWSRVVAVFQPHRYTRTAALALDFGDAFADADAVVVTDVYGAGEQAVPGVSGKLISDAVCARLPGRPVAYLPHRAELVSYLTARSRPGDLLLTLGAGDITSVGEAFLAQRAVGEGTRAEA